MLFIINSFSDSTDTVIYAEYTRDIYLLWTATKNWNTSADLCEFLKFQPREKLHIIGYG